MLNKLCCIALVLASQSSLVFANEAKTAQAEQHVIQPFTAKYNLIRSADILGSATRTLEYLTPEQAKYSYKTDIEWLIFSDNRQEVSLVKLDHHKVTPQQYNFQRYGTGPDKEYAWQFNIENNIAKNLKDKTELNIDFPVNIQDSLSYHLQNRLNLIKNPEQKLFVYPVMNHSGKVKNYVYQYDGEDELMLPFGMIKAVRLKREVIEKKKITYAWFAPELNYLLVKIQQIKSDVEQFDAQLTSLEEH
ncbi:MULTISPECIES: DUF3108 domain-containing protein [unclassified Colwellia]|jgi:hypothetical protein|uniref:DUF3108 domain-containing protein n=1 Tax=unclassified Colwellia TaxID=196834 RepID=UPI0015F61B8D|nr:MULTISPECIES: DUF3108 domain-containing protein [unclassified Colwellia]MBA6250876.1 DUF3108 domain-containing protein [Colwellia sp. MB3u-55]MBA6398774.1 DUF3108 domain-containing protein [Colwellia sp. BRX10-4]